MVQAREGWEGVGLMMMMVLIFSFFVRVSITVERALNGCSCHC
jgi:hypothetical protein